MRALFVVIDHPPGSGLPDFGQIPELIQIKQFVPIGSVEALDVCILVRFAGLDVVDHHPDRLGSSYKLAA